MFIILLSGFSCSGKDTVADILKNHGFTQYSVAERVKVQSSKYHGYPYELTQTQEGKKKIVTSARTNETRSVRDFLIIDSYLNKVINQDDAFWARLLCKQIQQEMPDLVVISDWRYLAEYEHLKFVFPEATILKVRVKRASITPGDDPSEHELDNMKFDFILQNDSTKEDLAVSCIKILNNV